MSKSKSKYKKTRQPGAGETLGKILSAIIWLLIGAVVGVGLVIGADYYLGYLPLTQELIIPATGIIFDTNRIIF